MADIIGIRREDKSIWERRTPIIPKHVRDLANEEIGVIVQPSEIRVYREPEYETVGARIDENLSDCKVVFGIKEIPEKEFTRGGTYVFFSHTIKGQEYNMPMLRKMMELGCNLIDYERVVDENNRRLIFFGRQAGQAGMVESIVAYGQRLELDELPNPFTALKRPLEYESLSEIRVALDVLGLWIGSCGLPEEIVPITVGITGYGNVSQGAQEMLDILPVTEVAPQELKRITKDTEDARHTIFKAVFKEEDMVRPNEAGAEFELQDYYDHPEKYTGIFEEYLPHLTMLVNCIYWTEAYPRLLTKQYVKDHWPDMKLRIVGDISCDPGGSIEPTYKPTEPGDPNYVYEPAQDRYIDGVEGDGPVIMAVDILPSEIPKDSSKYFSGVLREYIPAMARADYTVPFENLALPDPIKRAVILHHGELTPDYEYIKEFLK